MFDFSHHAHVIGGDEVDGDTLTTETATATNTMDVVFTVGGEIVVDDQGHLLDINTASEQIGGNEYTGRSRTELLHDNVTLSLLHVAVHGRHGEVTSSKLVGEPVDLPASVTEDDGLSNGDGLVEIGQGIELPLLLLDRNVKLLDTLEGEFVLLDKDADWVTHELLGHLEHVLGHRGRKQNNLGGLRQELEDVVDLLGETTLLCNIKVSKRAELR